MLQAHSEPMEETTMMHLIGIGGGGAPICEDCKDASIAAGETSAEEFVPAPAGEGLVCGFHDPS